MTREEIYNRAIRDAAQRITLLEAARDGLSRYRVPVLFKGQRGDEDWTDEVYVWAKNEDDARWQAVDNAWYKLVNGPAQLIESTPAFPDLERLAQKNTTQDP